MIEDFEYRHQLVMNLILVENDVRPAMLVQPVDYGESNSSDKITNGILMNVKKWFPNLILSENYKGSYEGIIISKKSHNDRTIYSNEMGEILGYPCHKDYKTIDREKEHYSINLVVYFKDIDSFPLKITLLANVCKDLSLKYKYESIAEKALLCLKTQEYYREVVIRVDVEIDKIVQLEDIIRKVEHNVLFDRNDKDEVLDTLYNLGFGTDLQYTFSGTFQFENEYHRGILLALLLFDKPFVFKPFVPINKYPQAREKHIEIMSKWEQEIIEILLVTSTQGHVGFDKDEIQKLKNSDLFSTIYTASFDTKNKVHKGVLLLLLSYVKYDCVEPFLQLRNDYPDNVKEVEKRLDIWVESISVFINTTSKSGGTNKRKKKTMRKRKQKRQNPNRTTKRR